MIQAQEDVVEDSRNSVPAIPGPSTSNDTQTATANFHWPIDQLHPLLTPNIVMEILENLDLEDIDEFRSVSRIWNEFGAGEIRERRIIVLQSVEAVHFYMQQIRPTLRFPHERFELEMECITEKQNTMKTFWITFGPHLKSLKISIQVLFMDTLFQLLSERLTNLEELHLENLPWLVDDSRTNRESCNPLVEQEGLQQPQFPRLKKLSLFSSIESDHKTKVVLKELLQAMPNLETLSLKNIPANLRSSGGNRLSRFLLEELISSDLLLPRLKNIHFLIEVGNLELGSLTRRRLQLRKLKIKLKAGVSNSALSDFLISVSPSLRKLEIIFSPNETTIFPAHFLMNREEASVFLQQVIELTLTNFKGCLNFVKKLKKLKRLSTDSSELHHTADSTCNINAKFPALVDDHPLEQFQTDLSISLCQLTDLSRNFPLLRVLKISGTADDGLEVIYRNLPYLETLAVSEGLFTDQGISGISQEICNDLADIPHGKLQNPTKYREFLFVGSLSHLKNLTLSCETMSDKSIRFGVLECSRLESLTLESSLITYISLETMAYRMPSKLKFLGIEKCVNLNEIGEIYVKNLMPGVKLILEVDGFEGTGGFEENGNRQVFHAPPEIPDSPIRQEYVAARNEQYQRLPLNDPNPVHLDMLHLCLMDLRMGAFNNGPEMQAENDLALIELLEMI